MNGCALELTAHYHFLVYVVAISYRMTIERERGEALCGSDFFSCPSSSQAKQLPYQLSGITTCVRTGIHQTRDFLRDSQTRATRQVRRN